LYDPIQKIRTFLRSSASRRPCRFGARGFDLPWTVRKLGFSLRKSGGACHGFSVEVMRSAPQRERGLMFRRFLPQERGMLFDFASEQPVMMWMKNTYLPLDIIFIGRAGKVVGLAENTEPLSEKIIPSGAPAYGVLEINAGTAARIGLRIGDSVRHPLFDK
jgi:uncharacterized protein